MGSWRARPSAGRLAAWLRAPGSLSARLTATGGPLEVRVLRQGTVHLDRDEAACLAGAGTPGWGKFGPLAYGREVVLQANGQPLVFARSVLRSVHARGAWKALRGLGTRSLADLLFGLPALRRSAFSFVRFAPGSAQATAVQAQWARATGQAWGRREVWARRSVFERRGACLLITECFVPALSRMPAPQRATAARAGRKACLLR